MRKRYHDLMIHVWLWLFDRAPTQGLALYCIAKASDHTYWDHPPLPDDTGEEPF